MHVIAPLKMLVANLPGIYGNFAARSDADCKAM
jgi:hypothetical protein